MTTQTSGKLQAGIEGEKFFFSIAEVKVFLSFSEATRFGQFMLDAVRTRVSTPEEFDKNQIFEEKIGGTGIPEIHPWQGPHHLQEISTPKACMGNPDCSSDTYYRCEDGLFRCADHI